MQLFCAGGNRDRDPAHCDGAPGPVHRHGGDAQAQAHHQRQGLLQIVCAFHGFFSFTYFIIFWYAIAPSGDCRGRELMPEVSVVVPAVSAGVQIVRGKHLLPFTIAYQAGVAGSGMVAVEWERTGPHPPLSASLTWYDREAQRERRSIQPRCF